MKNIKILAIRKKLDLIDVSILNLIKKRLILVNKVLNEKTLKNQIIDKKRINVILKRIKLKSQQKKIDPIITKSIWKAMINAFIDFEFSKFKKK